MIDVIITSPPYWNLKDYEDPNQIGLGQSYEVYLNDLKNIFLYCSKIVKDTGSLWIIIDTFKNNGNVKLLPFDLSKNLESKWDLKDIIIWEKNKNLPWSDKGKMRNIFEYILFFTKKGELDYKYYIDKVKTSYQLKKWWVKYPERYNPKGKTPSRLWKIPYNDLNSVWEFGIPSQGSWGNGWVRHSCPFPPELIERILLLTTVPGDVVFDPFAGSGSVLAQAKVMKRKAIGFDLNSNYKEMYNKTVFPEIERLWFERKKYLRELKYSQKKLQLAIENLRKLKYPKELIKKSIKQGFSKEVLADIKYILVLSKKNEKEKPRIFFIFNNQAPPTEKVEALLNAQKQISEWEYGFKPDLFITSKEEFILERDKMDLPKLFYVYSRGRTNFYEDKLTFSKLFENTKMEKSKYPPIISNIEVREKERELTNLFNFEGSGKTSK